MKKHCKIICLTLLSGLTLVSSAQVKQNSTTGSTSLPTGKKATPMSLLNMVSGYMEPYVYDGAHKDTKVNFNIEKGTGNVAMAESQWQCNVRTKSVPGQQNAVDMDVTFRLVKGGAGTAGVALAFNFSGWSKKSYVLLPAAVYNGNRFKAIEMGWPTLVSDPKDRLHDIAPIIANSSPHLNIDEGPSRIDIKAYGESTPSVCFQSPSLQKGFILLTHTFTRLGVTGISVEESPDRSQSVITLTAPTTDKKAAWQTGDSLTISCRIFIVPARCPIDLLNQFFVFRKSFSGQNRFENTVPFSKIFELEENLHNNERWDDSTKYYRQGSQNELKGVFSGVQLGWIGGMVEEQPLFMAGHELSRSRSAQSVQTILSHLQGESGLFYGIYKNGVLYSDDIRNKNSLPLLGMARKNGDGLYFLLQNMLYLKQSGYNKGLLSEAEKSSKKWADGLVNLWHRYNQFGQFFDVRTGELVVYGSTSGASVISALALASQYFHNSEYLQTAEAAAGFYYRRDLENGYSTGGPGDAIQCPDSESAFALVEAYTSLYEITQNKQYLKMAEDATAYFATWVTSYDYKFPEASALGKAGAKSTGSVWANTQNKHGAPAICIGSGNSLLKLYRATGNIRYLELLKDIIHNGVQFVSTSEKPLAPNMLPGYVCERVNLGDWEGEKNIGGHLYDSSPWVEVALMLSVTQNPGIYFDEKKGKLMVFDHVEARLQHNNNGKTVLWLKNPTAYDATYTIFADHDKTQPMGWNNYSKYQQVKLDAGKEIAIELK